MELAVKISAESTPSIRVLRPEVPPALEAAVAMCLEKELVQRYASVAELAQAIAPYGTRRAQALSERITGILGGAAAQLGQSDGGSTPALGGTLSATGRTAGAAPKSSATWLFSLVGIVALGASFVIVRSLVSGHTDATVAPSSLQSPPPTSGAAPPSVTQTVTQASPSGAPAPSAARATPLPGTGDESAPSIAPTTATAGDHPTPVAVATSASHPSRSTMATTTRPAPPPPVSVPAKLVPTADCTVPYTVDATGHHIYKPECN
jgi:serine/threonine-protein kinase